MALELDGFETWRAIADHPETFMPLRAEASKAARSGLSKFLRSKAVALPELRKIRKALGREIFVLVVNGMKDSELKTLVSRFDKFHPEQKMASAQWRRRHVFRLAENEIEPLPRPAKPAGRAPKSSKRGLRTTVERTGLSYVSAGATRKR